jgi:hypothetical protein
MPQHSVDADYRALNAFYQTKEIDLLSRLSKSEFTTLLLIDYIASLTPTEQANLLCDTQGNYHVFLRGVLSTVFSFGKLFTNQFWIPLWKNLSDEAKNRLMYADSEDSKIFLKKLMDRLCRCYYRLDFHLVFFNSLPEVHQATLWSDDDFCRHMIRNLHATTPDEFAWVWPRLSMQLKQSLIQLSYIQFNQKRYNFHVVLNKFSNQPTQQPMNLLFETLYDEPERFSKGMLASLGTNCTIAHKVGEFLENNTMQILWLGLTPELQEVLSKQLTHSAQKNMNQAILSNEHRVAPSPTPSILPLMSMGELKQKQFQNSVCLIDWDTLIAIDVNSPELSAFAVRGGKKTVADLKRLKNDGLSLVLLVNHRLSLAKRWVNLLKQSDDQYHFSNVKKPFLSLFDAIIYQAPHADQIWMMDAFMTKNTTGTTQHFLISQDESMCEYAKKHNIMPFQLSAINRELVGQDKTLSNAVAEMISDKGTAERNLQLAPFVFTGLLTFECVLSVVLFEILFRQYSLTMSISMSVTVLISLIIVSGLLYYRFMTNQHKIICLADHRDVFFNSKSANESSISCDENNISPSVSFGSLSDLP